MFAWPVINLSAKHDIYHTKIYSPSDKIKISFNSHYTMKMFTFSYMNFVHELVHKLFYYRPQRSWAKVMFLQASVILSTVGVSASVHAGIPPPWERTPPPGSRHPPGANTPRDQTSPQGQTPPQKQTHPLGPDTPSPEQTHPLGPPPPPKEADSGIWSTSGRYGTHPTGMHSCLQCNYVGDYDVKKAIELLFRHQW